LEKARIAQLAAADPECTPPSKQSYLLEAQAIEHDDGAAQALPVSLSSLSFSNDNQSLIKEVSEESSVSEVHKGATQCTENRDSLPVLPVKELIILDALDVPKVLLRLYLTV
jgi:hypothetical protein